jgi:hypothetical protein
MKSRFINYERAEILGFYLFHHARCFEQHKKFNHQAYGSETKVQSKNMKKGNEILSTTIITMCFVDGK